jgi:fatty acid desaturase
VTAVLAWVVGVCEISIVDYVCLFVYPGVSLTLLRSFIEHRPAPERAHRSAIVEAGPLLSLVFLFNNLHALHHREPGRPWYQLPARYRALRSELLRDNDGFYFPGYAAIALRYGLRPKDPPVHPARHSDAPC